MREEFFCVHRVTFGQHRYCVQLCRRVFREMPAACQQVVTSLLYVSRTDDHTGDRRLIQRGDVLKEINMAKVVGESQ